MKKILLGAIVTALTSGTLFFTAQPDGLLHVYFLNVGQGDSILIRTPSGKNILVDGGPEKKVLLELNKVLPFWNSTFDYIVPTHPDRDHIEGLIPVLKRYSVKNILTTGVYKNDYLSETFLRLIHEKNIPVTFTEANSDITFDDGVTIDILFPFSQNIGRETDTNSTSLVAEVIYGEHEILLTGDADASVEEKLIAARAPIKTDVLKVAHHGSKTSTGEAFLRAVNPEFAVISVGKGNSYHHPHPSVLKRLTTCDREILRTDLDGRIEMIFSKTELLEIKTQEKRVISAPSRRNFSSKCS